MDEEPTCSPPVKVVYSFYKMYKYATLPHPIPLSCIAYIIPQKIALVNKKDMFPANKSRTIFHIFP